MSHTINELSLYNTMSRSWQRVYIQQIQKSAYVHLINAKMELQDGNRRLADIHIRNLRSDMKSLETLLSETRFNDFVCILNNIEAGQI
jgi:hypothetical protein